MFDLPEGSSFAASGSTSRTLLERVRLHDPDAWRRFVHLYGPVVYHWTQRTRVQPHDAADIVQDVFHAVFQRIAKFQRQSAGESLRGWLWTITRNKVCDHFRQRQRQPSTLDAEVLEEELDRLASLPLPDADLGPRHAAELAHRALAFIQTEFEPTTWQAFLAMAVECLSAVETAHRLGLTPAAAYKAKSRVLQRLRSELDGLLEGPCGAKEKGVKP